MFEGKVLKNRVMTFIINRCETKRVIKFESTCKPIIIFNAWTVM